MGEPDAFHKETSPLKMPIVFNALALPLLLLSQKYFSHRFRSQEIELPWQTEIGLGWGPPFVLAGMLLVTLVMRSRLQPRVMQIWERVLVVALGIVIGHHIISMALGFPTGHTELS